MPTPKDIITPNLKVLFVGINPGLETARTGFHFAHRSNRFWSTLYKSGFTPQLLTPSENYKLADYGLGITNVIPRATKGEKELKPEEFEKGRKILLKKIHSYSPAWVAFVGVGLYRKTFGIPAASVGRQENIYDSKVWVLPQPSGLNAHYPPAKLVEEFKKFKNVITINKGE